MSGNRALPILGVRFRFVIGGNDRRMLQAERFVAGGFGTDRTRIDVRTHCI